MDLAKCRRLKEELGTQPEPQCVDIVRYFDGNDDEGSIGCNLELHPGMDTFRELLTGLLDRADVEAVYAQIAELDPGDEYWPYADTIYIIGSIPLHEVVEIAEALGTGEVGPEEKLRVTLPVAEHNGQPVMAIYWD